MNRKAYIIGRRKVFILLVSPESEGGDRGIKYKLRRQEGYNPRKGKMIPKVLYIPLRNIKGMR
jgi:hypothetical protein